MNDKKDLKAIKLDLEALYKTRVRTNLMNTSERKRKINLIQTLIDKQL
jgi:hypothetical protein